MQMQTNKAKIVVAKPLKKGTKVEWSSQAGGVHTKKRGTIVCVLKKDTNYYGGNNFPQNFMVPLFRTQYDVTVAKAQAMFAERSVWKNEWAMQSVYRLKFELRGRLYRNDTHYLVSVAQPGSLKLNLYHPAASTTLKVVR